MGTGLKRICGNNLLTLESTLCFFCETWPTELATERRQFFLYADPVALKETLQSRSIHDFEIYSNNFTEHKIE